MFVSKPRFLINALLSLALAGCGLLSGGAQPTSTVAPSPLPSTTPAAADTATLAATDTEAPIPIAGTPTLAPPSETPGAAASATTAISVTETASATAAITVTGSAPQGSGTDKADFVADVTVPDDTTFKPGQAFVKTWQLKNSGTNSWTTDYALVFVRGDQMGGPATVPLSATVAPGATTDLSVNLTAPAKLGSAIGFWMLRNAAGKLFGLSADANQPIYVRINVGAEAGPPPATAVPGALSVSAAALTVDPASFTGACPHTYTFNGTLTSSGAGNITYRLEAASDKPGFVFNLPAVVTSTFTTAGPRTFSVSYQLSFTGSVGGQAWLQVLTPNDLSSSKVSFSLTCQP